MFCMSYPHPPPSSFSQCFCEDPSCGLVLSPNHRREVGRAQYVSVLVNSEICVLTEKLVKLSHVGMP